MLRPIASYHQDDVGDWVADLTCGHGQHVRHKPPFFLRPWVVTAEGRASMLGTPLDCVLCDREQAAGLSVCGYFPKQKQPVPATFEVSGITDIASVSCCIVAGPPGWLDRWRHNDLGLFDSAELAESVIPEGHIDEYDLFAYRVLDQQFNEGRSSPWTASVQCAAPGRDFEPLGFDVVSRSSASSFECSPLSCNLAAKSLAKNEHCLFATLDDAIHGATAFSAGHFEPGPYHVVEVLRRRRQTGR